ncbi:MAG TPA: helix-turn-helix domain-containing protein, partial [archaeon]|nr:helix-turn-helix domain-containing protein [archaeon]
MDLEALAQIGLTPGEIKVYEALLELGECTKTALAKASRIAPSNIYDVTNRLVAKGLISKVEKNGVAHFSAANPSRLLGFLEEKERAIANEKAIVAALLPALTARAARENARTNVEVFQGWEGLRTVFEEQTAQCGRGDIIRVFGASAGADDERADRFFARYAKLRAQKGIATRIIFNAALRKRRQRVKQFTAPRC